MTVQVTKLYDDSAFPSIVGCALTDIHGICHEFMDKDVVFTEGAISSTSELPQTGVIACKVVSDAIADTGMHIITIDTSQPWGICSLLGCSVFDIHPAQLLQID